MEVDNQHDQSFWFVVREDQQNILFSSNNCDIQNPQIAEQEASYILDTGDKQYIQLDNIQLDSIQVVATESTAIDATGIEATEIDATVIDATGIETTAIDATVIDATVIDATAIDTTAIEVTAIDVAAIDTTVIDATVIDTTAIDATAIEITAIDATAIEASAIEAIETEATVTEATATEATVTDITETETTATENSATEPITKNNTKPLLINDENFWDRNKIKLLLTLCLDRRFKCPDTDKILFNEISILIGTTPVECDKKFRNLRRTYITLLRRKRLGKDIKWIHFGTCDSVFKHCKTLSPLVLEPWEHMKTKQLLKLYVENIKQFRNNKKITQKDIWKDIAIKLDTTEYNCFHKFKSLKRTYFKYVERTKETGKSIRWPYYHFFERIYNNYNRNLKVWDKNKIRALINAYSEIAYKFNNPKYQKKDLWKEIALKIGKNASECDRKFRNLKQTYIRLKRRSDSSAVDWRYFKDFAAVFERVPYTTVLEDGQERPLLYDYVHQMLAFCVRNKDKFKDPLGRKRMLWTQISSRLGLTPEQCAKKFRNMKRTYFKLLEKKRQTGKSPHWQYFSYFEQIYGIKKPKRDLEKYNVDNLPLPEIRNLVKNLQSKDADNFENLVKVIEDSNNIQRERNRILQELLNKK